MLRQGTVLLHLSSVTGMEHGLLVPAFEAVTSLSPVLPY